jgi:hypothetical protein
MPLPESFWWADASDGSSNLYLRYGSVASIKPDCTMKLKYWQKEFHAKAASIAQAKRFIERWLLARNTPRAHECARWRARYSRPAAAPQCKKADEISRLLREQIRPARGGLSSRIIKMDKLLPDDFESIADAGEPLQAFAPHADYSQIKHRRILVMPSVG